MAFAACAKSVLRSPSLRRAAAKLSSQASESKAGGARSFYANRSPFRISTNNPPLISRLPVESSYCLESLLPLHSAIASARLTSMLSAAPCRQGWLSEDS